MLTAYAVFDSKAAAFGMPMFISNKGLAVRGFSDACADRDSSIAKHPEDYALFEIGSYDPNSGKLTDVTPAVHVISASSVVELLQPAPAAGQPVLPLKVTE